LMMESDDADCVVVIAWGPFLPLLAPVLSSFVWKLQGPKLVLDFLFEADASERHSTVWPVIVDSQHREATPTLWQRARKGNSLRSVVSAVACAVGIEEEQVGRFKGGNSPKRKKRARPVERAIAEWIGEVGLSSNSSVVWVDLQPNVQCSPELRGIACSFYPTRSCHCTERACTLSACTSEYDAAFVIRQGILLSAAGLESPLRNLAADSFLFHTHDCGSVASYDATNCGASYLLSRLSSAIISLEQRKELEQYISVNTHFGRNKYIEYIRGNIPIILSAPHGGRLAPQAVRNISAVGP